MSTRDDARLTAEERAALSNLEALAAAADPQLAARLRGPRRWHPVGRLANLQARAGRARVPERAYSRWVCIPASIAALALTVLSMAVGLWLGVLGALVAAAGLTLLTASVARTITSGGPSADREP